MTEGDHRNPDKITLAATLDRCQVPVGSADTELKCLLRLKAPADFCQAAGSGVASNICLVFDCSTSMLGRRLQAAIDSAKAIVDTISERHRITLVAFQSYARVLVDNATAEPATRDIVKQKIEELREMVGGSTNLTEGIAEGMQAILRGSVDDRAAKVMVILSDGAANSPGTAEQAALSASNAGIQLFAVGIGQQYEANQLLRLVRPSNGAVFGDTDVEKISQIFCELIGRFDNFVATNVRLAAKFFPGVKPGLAYKTSPEKAFMGALALDDDGWARLNVGNIEGDRPCECLLQITMSAQEAGDHTLARVVLYYDIPWLGLCQQEKEITLAVQVVEGGEPTSLNSEVTHAFYEASIALLCESLVESYNRGDIERAAQRLQILIGRCNEVGDLRMKQHLEGLQTDLATNGRVSQSKLNACLLASTARTDDLPREERAGGRYDVVLLSPGDAPIRVMRELRDATSLSLRELNALLEQDAERVIAEAMDFDDAHALQQRLADAGARAEVRQGDTCLDDDTAKASF